MRKSTSSTRSRLLYAGVSAAAVAAGALVAPAAALAVANITALSPNGGPSGITVTVTGAADTFVAGATPAFVLTTAATCPTTYTTTATSPAVAYAGTSPTRISTTSASFVIPTTVPANVYAVCAYAGSGGTSALLNSSTTPTTAQKYTLVPASTISPTAGASGGGNTVSIALPTTQSWNTYNSVIFSPGNNSCTAVYGSPASNTVAAITPNSGSTTGGTVTVPVGVSGSLDKATPYTACIYTDSSAVGAATVLTSVGSASYNVSLPTVALNNSIGASTANLVASSTTNFLTGATTPAFIATSGTCPAVYGSPSANTFGTVLKSSNNRGAFTLPSGGTWAVGTTYNACFYTAASAGARLLGNASYTVATPPSATSVTPGGGSSLGGDLITVVGTNFPTSAGSITATLGGLPLLNVTPVDATTFTAVTPPHAAQAGVPIVVTTASGTSTLSGIFNYVNGISITPNTAPNTSTLWVDVKGVGFSALTFDTASGIVGGTATAPRIFLVDGKGACSGNTTACVGTDAYVQGANNNAVAECATPSVISDTELFCNLNLVSGALTINATTAAAATVTTVPNGTYTMTVVSNGKPDASAPTQSVISSGSTFTVAPF